MNQTQVNQMQEQDDEIDLLELFNVLLQKIGIIILSGVIFGSLAILGTKLLITPQYQSVTKLYVLNKQDSSMLSFTDLQTSSQLTKDYAEIIKSRKVTEAVIAELGLDMKLPPRVIPRPYTHLAEEGHLFANEHGLGDAYDARVLTAYYTEEQDIGNPSVLSSLAQEIGLDQSTFETALSEGIYREKLNEIESEVLQSIQPKTIPTILIGDSIRLDGGAYTPAQFRVFLDRASKEQQDITTISGAGCGENGCGF